MFRPTSMRKINIFTGEEHVEEVTVALAHLNVFHVAGAPDLEVWREATGEWSGLANTYSDQARRLRTVLQTLDLNPDEAALPDRLEPREDAPRIEQALDEIEQDVGAWKDDRDDAERSLERLRLLQTSVHQLGPLDIPVERLRELEYLYLTVGTMPRENLADLEVALFRIPFVVVPVYEYEDRVLVFAASAREHGAILDRALRSVYLNPLELPEELTGSPRAVAATLDTRIEEAERRLSELEGKRQQLAHEHGSRLRTLWRQAQSNAAVTDAVSQFGQHEDVYLLIGWVPARQLDIVIETVQEVTGGEADVEVLEPRVDGRQQAPTLLDNPRFLQPFEGLVSTFGMPAYDEIDPTPLVALTFVLMYGMMFGDIGHGMVLVLLGGWLYWRGGTGASLAPVLVTAGISGTLFGVLYGSVFGLETLVPHVWLRPLERIQDILIASVAGGVLLLNVGFLLHLISTWRSRDWGSMLFGENGLAGVGLYWALLGGGLALLEGRSLSIPLWLLLVLAPAVLIFLHEPLYRLIARERPLLEEGWGEYGVQSFFELFEALISYVSNSLSFVRLGAFAVAHAGLSQVVFMLAGRSGSLRWWVVVAVGTVLIVGFEGLIVGIQTLRLEYYEFFGKFFRGAGRPFAPLRLPEVQDV